MESTEKARQITEIAESKQASDIIMLDVQEISSLADYFVVMTVDNNRQLEAVSDEIIRTLKRSAGKAQNVEGDADSGWILIDWSDVIVHIMTKEQRDRYALEELWEKAKTVLRIQ